MTRSRGERFVLSLVAALLLGLLGVHFACTLLYLTPPNPIRIALHAPLMRYMHPYFYQSWRLFAPDPGGTDSLLLVNCNVREGSVMVESDWFDITTPLHEHRYRRRFSPALLLARAQEPRLLLRADPMNEAIRRYGLPNPTIEAAREALAAEARRQFESGRAHANRIASAACDRRFGVGRTAQVSAQLVLRKVPPFGMREGAPTQEDTYTLELPWAPYEVVDGY
ncbi:DUF5819 family protein [Polyangium sp. 15x6]|uniref:DUF5819 family protein n=1 Tax=Polyangium sp. 15x6 TaxID=3042687 RepID=UPI002499D7A7|nr:DUF5819 family protein [Polyangium sp. 15x6]MDI3285981.1 DUF5819 family protein [Polyangium sp. 15x6]